MTPMSQKTAVRHEESTCLGCAGDRIPLGSHICWFYRSPAERDAVVLPFLKAGIDTREQCHYILEEREHPWLKTGLERHGVDVEASISSGQLSILDPVGLYSSSHNIDFGEKSSFWDAIYANPCKTDFPMMRLVKDMNWMGRESLNEEMLLEYEIGLNYHLRKNQGVAICQYDLTKFRGDVILDILKVHPIIIWGRTAVRNPFYVDPVILRDQSVAH